MNLRMKFKVVSQSLFSFEQSKRRLEAEGLPDIDLILSLKEANLINENILINEMHKMKFDLNKIRFKSQKMVKYLLLCKNKTNLKLRSNILSTPYFDIFGKDFKLHVKLIKEIRKIFSDEKLDFILEELYPEYLNKINNIKKCYKISNLITN